MIEALQDSRPDLNPFTLRDQTLSALNIGGDKGNDFVQTEFGQLYRLYSFCGGCVQEALAVFLACLILTVIFLLYLVIIVLLLYSTF